MTQRYVTFAHDGHEFLADERVVPGADPRYEWAVRMDGALVLEFGGAFPYRDVDVTNRIVAWYETQRPR